jgi:5'-nucleotidase
MVQKLDNAAFSTDVTLNVNVPDVPFDSLRGVRAARLGFRHKSEPIVREKDPHGRTIFWVGPAGRGADAGKGTDFHAVDDGAVAVTPLKVDLTRHDSLPQIAEWLSG